MLRLLYIVLLFIVLAVSCGQNHTNRFRWTDLSVQADSIAQRLEWGFVNLVPDDSLMQLIEELEQSTDILKRNPEFTEYYRARIIAHAGFVDSAALYLRKADKLCDSTRHPYEQHRINELQPLEKGDIVQSYKNLTNALQYAQQTKDTFLLASVSNRLGLLFGMLNDTVKSSEYCQRAIDYYQAIGMHRYARSVQLNLIPRLYSNGDTAMALKLLHQMRNDSIIMRDSTFRVNWIIDAWTYLREDWAIDSLYSMASRPNTMKDKVLAYIYAMKADQMRARGDTSLGYQLSLKAVMYAERQKNNAHTMEMYHHHTWFCRQLGMTDSALLYSLGAWIMRDTVEKEGTKTKIHNVMAKSEIEKAVLEKEYESSRNILLLCLVMATVIIGVLVIIVWQTQRYRHMKSNAECARTDTERNRHLLGKALLRLHEKNKSIQSLTQHIEKNLDSNDKLPGLYSDKRILALSQRGDNDLETNRKVLEDIPSTLMVNLRHRNPNITPGMLQLAQLIASGISNKEISDMMGIQPESVKKRRYRLRLQLQLTHDENLEEYLRSLC